MRPPAKQLRLGHSPAAWSSFTLYEAAPHCVAARHSSLRVGTTSRPKWRHNSKDDRRQCSDKAQRCDIYGPHMQTHVRVCPPTLRPTTSGTTRPAAKQLNTPFLPDLIRAITGAVLLPARPPRSGRPPPLKPSRRHHTLRHWHKGRNRSPALVPAFPQRQREQHLCYLLAESASFSSVPNKTSRKKRVFVRAANASQLAGKETHPAVMSRRRF